jgi:adenosylcobinamide-phosphate synthase
MRRGVGAAAGPWLDRCWGEPPDRAHPVAWFGTVMTRAEGRWYRDSRAAGVWHAAVGVALGAAVGAMTPLPVAVGLATSGRMLGQAARSIGDALAAGDLAGARRQLPTLVGRDPEGLDVAEIARAVVESVAENAVDAVVAPVFWAVVAGSPGVGGHRAVNTLDAMVGHRSARYARFGWASARLDDAAAWLPARLTAVAVAVARPHRAASVLRAVRHQAPAHPSPNAGVAEAAFAAALGISLGGVNRYEGRVEQRATVGSGPAARPADIERAVALLRDVTVAVTVGAAAVGPVVTLLRRGTPRGGPRLGRSGWRPRRSRPSR